MYLRPNIRTPINIRIQAPLSLSIYIYIYIYVRIRVGGMYFNVDGCSYTATHTNTHTNTHTYAHTYLYISGAFGADDLALLANKPPQGKSIRYSLELAERDNDLYLKSVKTDFIGFNLHFSICSLNAKILKLIDQFIYPGSNIFSTKSDINMRIVKAWTATDFLSI